MKLSDLQPLDKVCVCRHAVDAPDLMVNVDHRDAGELDFLCDQPHDVDDLAWMHAAHLGVAFPQVRTLEEVPLAQYAAYEDGVWVLKPLPYGEGDGPGEMPPPPDAALTLNGWSYTCACCGEVRKGLPELGFEGPAQVSDAERDPAYEVVSHDEDLCRMRIDGEMFYFIRALLPVPIPEARDTYCFGVWSSISTENFARYAETMDTEQRDLGQMFGYLCNGVPGVPDSMGLKQWIVPGRPGQRPWLTLWEPDAPHPLYDAQKNGITVADLLAWLGDDLPCDGSA